ncbi:MAG: hypothetical protein IJZ42_01685 [Lachnospiraceae bacterium]|nr:hypothetical protein [Lachnospiraceae bacterium]
MSNFITLCIFFGVLVGGALAFLIYSFSYSACLTGTQLSSRFLAYSLAMCAVITVIKLVVDFDKCPNCDTFTDSAYCQECGTEVNPDTHCHNCGKEFYIGAVPAFCSDCGTKVKE